MELEVYHVIEMIESDPSNRTEIVPVIGLTSDKMMITCHIFYWINVDDKLKLSLFVDDRETTSNQIMKYIISL